MAARKKKASRKKAKQSTRARLAQDRFRRLRDAGVIDPDAFDRLKSGRLSKASADRVMNIYDRVGGLISNPVDRPFHTYKPRKRENLKRAEGVVGVQVSRLKGVRGIPLPIKQGGRKPRIRFVEEGISIEYDRQGLIGRTLEIEFDQKRLAADPERYLNELERKYKLGRENINLRLRTGSASLGAFELEGNSFAERVMGLMARYPRISNADPNRTPYNEWLNGFMVTELNDSKPRRKKRKAKRKAQKRKAKRKAKSKRRR